MKAGSPKILQDYSYKYIYIYSLHLFVLNKNFTAPLRIPAILCLRATQQINVSMCGLTQSSVSVLSTRQKHMLSSNIEA